MSLFQTPVAHSKLPTNEIIHSNFFFKLNALSSGGLQNAAALRFWAQNGPVLKNFGKSAKVFFTKPPLKKYILTCAKIFFATFDKSTVLLSTGPEPAKTQLVKVEFCGEKVSTVV
jgi:hypothetical protein